MKSFLSFLFVCLFFFVPSWAQQKQDGRVSPAPKITYIKPIEKLYSIEKNLADRKKYLGLVGRVRDDKAKSYEAEMQRRIRRYFDEAIAKKEFEYFENEREARKAIEQALKVYPNDPIKTPRLLYKLAFYLYREDDRIYEAHPEKMGTATDFIRTVRILQRLERDYPEFDSMGDVYYRLGDMYEKSGSLGRSKVYFLRMLEEYPNSLHAGEVRFRLGEASFDEERYAEAINYYRPFWNDFYSPYLMRSLYKSAWSYYILNQYAKAQTYFYTLLTLESEREVHSSQVYEEALSYLALSFVEGAMDKAMASDSDVNFGERAFKDVRVFLSQRGNTTLKPMLLFKVAETLMHLVQIEAAQNIGRYLAKNHANHERMPKWYHFFSDSYSKEGNIREDSEFHSDLLGNFDRAQKTSESQEQWIRTVTLKSGLLHHQLGRQLKKAKQVEQSERHFQSASEAYAAYLHYYLDSADAEDAYSYLAEAALDGKRYMLASNAFENLAFWWRPLPEQAVKAEKSVLSLRALMEEEEGKGNLEKRDLLQIDVEKEIGEKLTLPSLRKKYIRLVEKTVKKYPRMKLADSFLFQNAALYFSYGWGVEGEKRLLGVIEQYPKSNSAKVALKTLIQRSVKRADFVGAQVWVNKYGFLLSKNERKDLVSMEADFRFRGYVKQYGQVSQERKSNKTAKNRAELVRVAESFYGLSTQRYKFSDKALYNAANAFAEVADYDRAFRLFSRITKKHRTSEHVDEAYLGMAQMKESQLKYGEAARLYSQFSKRYAKHEQAQAALLNSSLLYEADQQYRPAASTLLRYARTIKDPEKSVQLQLQAADWYEKVGDKSSQKSLLQKTALALEKDKTKAHLLVPIYSKLSQLASTQKDKKLSRRYLIKATAAYDNALKKSDVALEAAQAELALLEPGLAVYKRRRINAATSRVQKVQLEKKGKSLQSLQKKYERVIQKYGHVVSNSAALLKIGQLYESMYRALLSAPCPRDVRKIGEDACDEYQNLLEDRSEAVKTKALAQFSASKKQAQKTPDAAKYRKDAQMAINSIDPENYGVVDGPQLFSPKATLPRLGSYEATQ